MRINKYKTKYGTRHVQSKRNNRDYLLTWYNNYDVDHTWSSLRLSVILDCGKHAYPLSKHWKKQRKSWQKIFHHYFTDEKWDGHILLVIYGGNNNKIKNILLIFSLMFLTSNCR